MNIRQSKVYMGDRINFWYAIGLIVTDGSLSKDGRHIDFTSKDIEQVENIKEIFRLDNKIGLKKRGDSDNLYNRIQFGDKNFYEFLLTIGLTPNKSKTLNKIKVPDKYFFNFFRGCLDGDGTIGSFKHPESRFPQIRLRISSGSSCFLDWLLKKCRDLSSIEGGFIQRGSRVECLTFCKHDAIILLDKLNYSNVKSKSLTRKSEIVQRIMLEWRNGYTR